MTINGVLTLTMPVAAAQTPGDAVQSGQVTWFQDAFNNYLNPMLEANPQLGTILTWVAVADSIGRRNTLSTEVCGGTQEEDRFREASRRAAAVGS